MDETPKVKTVRVRINVDENAPPRTRAGEVMRELVNFAKKIVPSSEKSLKNRETKR